MWVTPRLCWPARQRAPRQPALPLPLPPLLLSRWVPAGSRPWSSQGSIRPSSLENGNASRRWVLQVSLPAFQPSSPLAVPCLLHLFSWPEPPAPWSRQAGGSVINGRISGRLEVSRAFGDRQFKKVRVLRGVVFQVRFVLLFAAQGLTATSVTSLCAFSLASQLYRTLLCLSCRTKSGSCC